MLCSVVAAACALTTSAQAKDIGYDGHICCDYDAHPTVALVVRFNRAALHGFYYPAEIRRLSIHGFKADCGGALVTGLHYSFSGSVGTGIHVNQNRRFSVSLPGGGYLHGYVKPGNGLTFGRFFWGQGCTLPGPVTWSAKRTS